MTEHQIQSAFIQWVRMAEKQDERLRLLFAVPNGGQRHIVTAMKLKSEGVRPGVPDVMFPYPVKGDEGFLRFAGLAIEFKVPKGWASKAQLKYLDLLAKNGWLVVICTDAEAAIRTVKDYLR